MSTFLQENQIKVIPHYEITQLQPVPDLIIIGNAMKRGVTWCGIYTRK